MVPLTMLALHAGCIIYEDHYRGERHEGGEGHEH